MKQENHCKECSYHGNEWASTGVVGCTNSNCFCHTGIPNKTASTEQQEKSLYAEGHLAGYLQGKVDGRNSLKAELRELFTQRIGATRRTQMFTKSYDDGHDTGLQHAISLLDQLK